MPTVTPAKSGTLPTNAAAGWLATVLFEVVLLVLLTAAVVGRGSRVKYGVVGAGVGGMTISAVLISQ
jgi:hypothetical protein